MGRPSSEALGGKQAYFPPIAWPPPPPPPAASSSGHSRAGPGGTQRVCKTADERDQIQAQQRPQSFWAKFSGNETLFKNNFWVSGRENKVTLNTRSREKEQPHKCADGSSALWGAVAAGVGGTSPDHSSSHAFSAEAPAWTMTCVGCHDDEIETGINNSHSAHSLTCELTCHYASSCRGRRGRGDRGRVPLAGIRR